MGYGCGMDVVWVWVWRVSISDESSSRGKCNNKVGPWNYWRYWLEGEKVI
jgi:hypothetical protein